MSGKRNRLHHILMLLVICISAAGFCFRVEAATRQNITRLTEAADLTVMFSFDKENVDITFISPQGKLYTKEDAGVEFADGELWSTYRITGAEAGDWAVEYELGVNSQIEYSIIEEEAGIWIQYVNIVSQQEDSLEVSFEADGDGEAVWFDYTLWAVCNTDDSLSGKIQEGRARTEEETLVTANLGKLNSGDYTLKLEVSRMDGDAEVFDSMMGDSFSYTNGEAPEGLDNYKVYLDMSRQDVRLDWSESAVRADEYQVSVYGTELLYQETLDREERETSFSYPADTSQLQLSLSGKQNNLWSAPVVITIPIPGEEYLRNATGDVTGSGQLALEYAVTKERTLTVQKGEESAQYLLNGTDTVYITLQQGINRIYAEFEGDNNIFYVADTEVYYDLYPPEIILYDALDGKTFSGESVDILGKVKDAESLTINGEAITIEEDGSFTYSCKLSTGENLMELKAQDGNGNMTMRVLTLYKAGAITGKVPENSFWMRFLPLLISLGCSLIIILFAAIFIRKKKKKEDSEQETGEGQIETRAGTEAETGTDTEAEGTGTEAGAGAVESEQTGEKKQQKKQKKTGFPVKWLVAVLLAGLATGICIWQWIRCELFIRSLEYLTLVEQSFTRAYQYLQFRKILMISSGAGVAICLLLIIITILVAKKRKKRREGEQYDTSGMVR